MAQTFPEPDLWSPPTALGPRIRHVRERRGMSQAELARRMTEMGVPTQPPHLSRLELFGTEDDHARRPQFAHIMAICVILEVKPKELGATVQEYPELRIVVEHPEFATLE